MGELPQRLDMLAYRYRNREYIAADDVIKTLSGEVRRLPPVSANAPSDDGIARAHA